MMMNPTPHPLALDHLALDLKASSKFTDLALGIAQDEIKGRRAVAAIHRMRPELLTTFLHHDFWLHAAQHVLNDEKRIDQPIPWHLFWFPVAVTTDPETKQIRIQRTPLQQQVFDVLQQEVKEDELDVQKWCRKLEELEEEFLQNPSKSEGQIQIIRHAEDLTELFLEKSHLQEQIQLPRLSASMLLLEDTQAKDHDLTNSLDLLLVASVGLYDEEKKQESPLSPLFALLPELHKVASEEDVMADVYGFEKKFLKTIKACKHKLRQNTALMLSLEILELDVRLLCNAIRRKQFGLLSGQSILPGSLQTRKPTVELLFKGLVLACLVAAPILMLTPYVMPMLLVGFVGMVLAMRFDVCSLIKSALKVHSYYLQYRKKGSQNKLNELKGKPLHINPWLPWESTLTSVDFLSRVLRLLNKWLQFVLRALILCAVLTPVAIPALGTLGMVVGVLSAVSLLVSSLFFLYQGYVRWPKALEQGTSREEQDKRSHRLQQSQWYLASNIFGALAAVGFLVATICFPGSVLTLVILTLGVSLVTGFAMLLRSHCDGKGDALRNGTPGVGLNNPNSLKMPLYENKLLDKGDSCAISFEPQEVGPTGPSTPRLT